MSAGQTEIAAQKVARFVGRFGESYRWLAYYAALPLILTPELLNYLRNRFLRDKVPWVAEVDLLLSELCRPVGYEQFAMAPEVRAYLIGEMREQLGEAPMREVARLLIRYVHQLSRANAPFSRDELEAEQWSAMVYLKSGGARRPGKLPSLSASSSPRTRAARQVWRRRSPRRHSPAWCASPKNWRPN